jgi:hypothetical protein
VAAAAAIVIALAAHHSVLPFDGATATTLDGNVARILWQNPHALIAVDVAAGGTVERWTIEGEGATTLERLGWTRDAVKAGDRIVATGARAKDGRRLIRCRTITIRERELPCFARF